MVILGIAIGLIAWALIFLVPKPTPMAGLILVVCQLPFALVTFYEYLMGTLSIGLIVALILDFAFAGIAWVLFAIRRKHTGD
ncbi:MAG: hypothetical protein IT416_00515 [Candidatus Pacebacteria bacterium]|nr:hypothetical protein [Candidatus Paceibacterota bacterium]